MKRGTPAKKNKKTEYTVTEVGTLLEDIRTQVKSVAEGHGNLDRRLESLEIEVHGNSRRLERLESTSNLVLDKTLRLEDAVSKLNKDLKETREELKKDISEVRKELKKDISDVREELKATKTELKGDIAELGSRLVTVETRA